MNDIKQLCPAHGGVSVSSICTECLATPRTNPNPRPNTRTLESPTEHYELTRPITPASYVGLQAVLDRAFEQATIGKGAARHANGLAFEDQPMQKLIDLYGVGFAFGQAAKKMQEAQGMLIRGEIEAAVREMLGAIVYAAGVVIHEEKQNG